MYVSAHTDVVLGKQCRFKSAGMVAAATANQRGGTDLAKHGAGISICTIRSSNIQAMLCTSVTLAQLFCKTTVGERATSKTRATKDQERATCATSRFEQELEGLVDLWW